MSLHLVLLYGARSGLARGEFLAFWRDVHSARVASLPQVRRYVRNIVLTSTGRGSAWDGADEIWVDDEAAADSVVAALRTTQAQFVDTDAVVCLHTVDHTVFEGRFMARDASHPKRMTFLRRKEGLGLDEMLHHWRHKHGPLAASVPGLRRYVQSAVVTAAGEHGEPAFDGVAQIWLHDEKALGELLASSLFREQVKPDEANFTATGRTLTLAMREERVVWPDAL